MNEKIHLDLFSGIGGFALAAKWAGYTTVCFVERDLYCQQVLRKNFPGVPICHDIRFCGRQSAEWWDDRPIDLLTGGFPCQPVSCAGKRKGKEDDRWLWPEMRRVIAELRPRWVLGENVAGLINMGLDDVFSDLEAEGYEVGAVVVPACAVGAPHRRDRVWIVAHDERAIVRNEPGRGGWPSRKDSPEPSHNGIEKSLADTERWRWDCRNKRHRRPTASLIAAHGREIPKGHWQSEPDVGRVVDGLSYELDCIRRLNEKSNDQETESARSLIVWRFLREVWRNHYVAKASPKLFIRLVHRAVPEMPRSNAQSRWLLWAWIEKRKELRDLWQEFYSTPFEKAHDLQQGLLERIGKAQRPKEMASRVDRLRALGNAIVPKVAFEIIRGMK